jgi:LuxR family transcriptional regulator, maltose regulon positive regulatory protein
LEARRRNRSRFPWRGTERPFTISRTSRPVDLAPRGLRIGRTRLAGRVEDALEPGSLVLTAGAGCGKTVTLEQVLGAGTRPFAWVSCSPTARSPGALATMIVNAIAAAVPGSADALAETMAASGERVDGLAITRELIEELSRLLVEPLVVVVDDAEQLDGAGDSLRILSELVRAELPLLHVAVASRRPLALKVAKVRASGRLTELTTADLAFDAEECAELLRRRTGQDPPSEHVEVMMELTEGWPLGIALAAGLVERATEAGDLAAALGGLRSAPDLREYLSEELLDSLEPELREAALASSVVPVVTAAVERALDLPDEFASRIEGAGLLVRRTDDGFVYHPLLRDFLLERLRAQCSEDEWRSLNAAAAPALDADGDAVGAIEHWLEAHAWQEAVAAMEREGFGLARTAPELIPRWLSLLPETERGYPTMRALEGQLQWRAGDNEAAIAALADAIGGFRERPNVRAEWAARSILVDLLFATHTADEVKQVVEGWDRPEAAEARALAPAVAMYGAGALASFGRFEESEQLAAEARRHPEGALLPPFQALQRLFIDLPRGEVESVCEQLEAAGRGMEHFDPLQRRQIVLGVLAIVVADRGDPDEALSRWVELSEMVRGRGAPLLTDAAHAWGAVLNARAGRLAEAEAELAQIRNVEWSARSFSTELAPAEVASLRGDAPATLAAAERTLAMVRGGPILFRYWGQVDLVPALADVGLLERAAEVLAETRELIDAHYPGELGRYLRGRLLGLHAWLAHLEGESELSDADLIAMWETTGDSLRYILRRDWERLRVPLWGALERGTLAPEQALEQVAAAHPDGLELTAFLDHPVRAVRGAALEPAVRSGDPRALEILERLRQESDADLASAAGLAVKRLASSLPPLRFELLGRFDVRRGAWRAGGAWGRPIDARFVRFLLVHLERPVLEDELFEGLWPDLSAASARRSLQVAASRARQLLDPPGAERSLIESVDRTYRLALGERDRVDAYEFQSAAEIALRSRGEERRTLLGRARSLWHGEPVPEERYTDWAIPYREALLDRYTAVLTALVELDERAGDHAGAADTARELVHLDPLNEGAHRALMVAYARAGRTGHALRQYLECRRALVETLGIEPAEATSRLQTRILAGETV